MMRLLGVLLLLVFLGAHAQELDFDYFCEHYGTGGSKYAGVLKQGTRNAEAGISTATTCTFKLMQEKRHHDDPLEMCSHATPYPIQSTQVNGNEVTCVAAKLFECTGIGEFLVGHDCLSPVYKLVDFPTANQKGLPSMHIGDHRMWMSKLGGDELGLSHSWLSIDGTPEEFKVTHRLREVNGLYMYDWISGEERTKQLQTSMASSGDAFAIILTNPSHFHVKIGDIVIADKSIWLPHLAKTEGRAMDHLTYVICDKMKKLRLPTVYFEDHTVATDANGEATRPKCFFITSNSHNVKTLNPKGIAKLHESCPKIDGLQTVPAIFEDPYVMRTISQKFVDAMGGSAKDEPLSVRIAAMRVRANQWSSPDCCSPSDNNGFCENRIENVLWYFFNRKGQAVKRFNADLWAVSGDWDNRVVYPVKQCADTPQVTAVLDLRLGGLVNVGPERRLPVLCVAESRSTYPETPVTPPTAAQYDALVQRFGVFTTGCRNHGGMSFGSMCLLNEVLKERASHSSSRPFTKERGIEYDEYRHNMTLMAEDACNAMKQYKYNIYAPIDDWSVQQRTMKLNGYLAVMRDPKVARLPETDSYTDYEQNNKFKKDPSFFFADGTAKTNVDLRKEFKFVDKFGRANDRSVTDVKWWQGNQPDPVYFYRENCIYSNTYGTGLYGDWSCFTYNDYLCQYHNDINENHAMFQGVMNQG